MAAAIWLFLLFFPVGRAGACLEYAQLSPAEPVPTTINGTSSSLKRLVVSAHHRTGIFFGNCLTRVLGEHGIAATLAAHGSLGAAHAVNFARDPFLLVDAAFLYHAKKLERWARVPLEKLEEHSAAARAYVALQRAPCLGEWQDYVFQSQNVSYGDAVFRWPLALGLLFEAVRCLYRDVPFLVAATLHCAELPSSSSSSSSCKTFLLDDSLKFSGLDEGTFDDLLARDLLRPLVVDALDDLGSPTRRRDDPDFFLESIKRDFFRQCEPRGGGALSSSSPRGGGGQHPCAATKASSPASPSSPSSLPGCGGGGRAERIRLLLHLDEVFLGHALAEANATIAEHAVRLGTKVHPWQQRRKKQENNKLQKRRDHMTTKQQKLAEKLIFASVSKGIAHPYGGGGRPHHRHHSSSSRTA